MRARGGGTALRRSSGLPQSLRQRLVILAGLAAM